ncbi:hypothetical protein UY286_04790 [Paenibacillus polymyxa]|uniref:hypothetical protein n=1 Tax=Paenibacillus polymyxa TaxID=1406 RepID=UPI002AB5254A|nr:hypothetical protein [Paenibacillus polymyxa]MDY7989886.1 hypothetical protein [Paenibacillus polymyxa]MDY8116755.1 hypothetical protein [Paenibacillus polymyxa]
MAFKSWMFSSCQVPYSIERVFMVYMLGGMTSSEYCQRVSYLLEVKEARQD